MATLERGFKSWSERTAASFRRELGLSDDSPLDLRALAEVIGVKLMTPNDLPGVPKEVLQVLLVEDPGGWSAVSLTSRDRADRCQN